MRASPRDGIALLRNVDPGTTVIQSRRYPKVLPVPFLATVKAGRIRQPVKPSRGRLINPLSRWKPAQEVSEMMHEYRSNSYLFGGNAPYVEEMYEAYLDNPGSVPDNWRAYFDALQNVPAADGTGRGATWPMPPSSSRSRSAPRPTPSAPRPAGTDLAVARKQVHVQSLIAAYRFLGSRWADLDPLKRQERPKIPNWSRRSTT
jgi:hypothetical protein